MTLVLRLAGPNDAETIFAFIKELAAYEREPQAVKTTPQILAGQLESLHPPFECVLAESAGEARGFALFFHNYSTWRGARGLYLEDLFVPAPFRGQGIGRALLQELARIAKSRHCARMEWMVLDWNQSAIAFYQSLGAVPLHDWTVFRLSDAALDRLAATNDMIS